MRDLQTSWHGDANVDSKHGSAEPFGEPLGVGALFRVDARRVAVRINILDGDGCVPWVHADNAQNRAENLVLHGRVVAARVQNNGRAHPEPLLMSGGPRAAVEQNLRTASLGLVDVFKNSVCARRREWA